MTKSEIANLKELALTCQSRTEFALKHRNAYVRIRSQGDDFAEKIFAHMPRKCRKPYTRPELEKLATRYETRTQWKLDSPASYHAAVNMNILDEIAPKSLRGKWKRK